MKTIYEVQGDHESENFTRYAFKTKGEAMRHVRQLRREGYREITVEKTILTKDAILRAINGGGGYAESIETVYSWTKAKRQTQISEPISIKL